MTIVRSAYRYKPPPRKRKAVPLEVPAVVTISDKTRKRVWRSGDMIAEPAVAQRSNASTPAEPAPANDDRKPAATTSSQAPTKSAIVTARTPGKRRYVDLPEMTEEEHRAAGDRADAMMQAFKRQIAATARKANP